MKRIIQDSKDNVTEADIRSRMQPLKDMLTKSIDHLHTVFVSHVFVSVCRGFWDRMGQVKKHHVLYIKNGRSIFLVFFLIEALFFYRMYLVFWRTRRKVDRGTKVHV